MKVVLLGTGTPNADPERSGPAVAIVVNGASYLIDCGPGVVRRAAAAAQKADMPELKAQNLTHLFVTHLHTDHTVGLPDVIFTPWVLERRKPLEAYGPVGLAHMVKHVRKAYEKDMHLRLDGLEPADDKGHRVNVYEIQPGVIYSDENVKVTAFPVDHGSWDAAYGFKFESADRTIVISGDTRPCDALIEHAQGCDVLVHEVYSQAGFEKREPVWQKYHSSFHTSTHELANIANQVKPKILVLYHQLYWGSTDADLLSEIGESYNGLVVSGSDLDVY